MARNVIQSTLQLLGVPGDINEETIIKTMNKYGGKLVQVKQVRMLSDVGSTLVTITATGKDLQDYLKQFPIQINKKQVILGKLWRHTSKGPSTVILENPPVEVSVQNVNKYLEEIGINATITVSQNSVLITLNDPSDLPYLVTKCHTVNDHRIVFKEISSQNPNNLTSDTQNGSMSQDFQKSTAMDIPRNRKDSLLHIKNLPEDAHSLSIKTNFKELFQEGGHTMTEFIHVQHDNVAYIKFKDENSIPQLLASPPDDSTLLGHPIKYSIIEESKVKTPNDHVLVVDGLPSHISNIDQYLCVYLKNTTKVLSIKSCKVVQQKAFVEYESPEDVQNIIQSPPLVPFFQKILQFTQSTKCFLTEPENVTIAGNGILELVIADNLPPPLSETEDQLIVNQEKWQLIMKHRAATTISIIESEALKMKVKLTYPNADNSSDVICICGDETSVQHIKRQLSELLDKVFITDFTVSPLNLHELVMDGTIKAECQQLEEKHKTFISYDTNELPSRSENDPTTPRLLVKATSPVGSRVTVYSGNTFTYVKCDAIACFISTTPSAEDPVLLSLMSAGGSELQHEISSYLHSKSKLLPATLHRISTVGSLKCRDVYLIVLPCYNDDPKNLIAKPQSSLETAINELITQSIVYGTDIVIAPISCAPLNYPTELVAEVLIQVLTGRSSKTDNDLNFSIFVESSSCKAIFESKMREYGYHTYHQYLPHLSQSPSELSFSVTVEQLKKSVKITQGDMMSIGADVYINSTNPEFDLSKGVLSQKFKQLCGRKLVDEAREYIRKSGKLKPGQVAVTSANNTKAKCIFHVALLRYIEEDSLKTFRETVKTIFQKTREYGYRSISIPCLGSVGLGYPASETAKIVFEEIITFLSENPQTIMHFHIIVFRTSDFNAYAKEFDCSLKTQDFIELVKKHLNPKLYKVQDKMRLEDCGSGKLTRNHLIVKLCNGSIIDEETNVIVTNTSDDMKTDSKKISKAVYDAAGQQFKKSLLADSAKFVKGLVIPINACGALRCNKVYHVRLPGKMKGIPPNQTQRCFFEDYIYKCLLLAENEKQKSISFPAFCVGSGNYSIPESAEPTFNAIRKFTTVNPMHLKEVHIVIADQEIYEAFYFHFLHTFPSSVEKSNELSVSLRLQSNILPRFPEHLCKTPNLRECKLSFRIVAFNERKLIEAKRELIASINKQIVDDMVDLGETAFLLNESDIDEIIELAEKHNIDVKFQQSLNRVLVSGVETSVKNVCQQIQKKVNELSHVANELRPYEWSSKHEDGTIAIYTLDVTMQLELAYKREQSKVQVVIDGIQCTIDLKAMEERRDDGVIRTIKRNVKIEDFPRDWDYDAMMSKVVHYADISTKSSEYKKATALFLETLGESCHNYEIVKVHRIQNLGEYTRYQSVKRTWLRYGNVKEKELFHGTKKDNIESICSTGFNRSFAAESNAANFGKGVYFALNSWYSLQDNYSTIDSDGYKHILVCSVLVCNVTRGKSDMKVPPPLNDNPQILYDTLVDDESNPTIFVAMRDSQAYPNYWITVKM